MKRTIALAGRLYSLGTNATTSKPPSPRDEPLPLLMARLFCAASSDASLLVTVRLTLSELRPSIDVHKLEDNEVLNMLGQMLQQGEVALAEEHFTLPILRSGVVEEEEYVAPATTAPTKEEEPKPSAQAEAFRLAAQSGAPLVCQ